MNKATYPALKRIVKACKWYNELSEDDRLKNKDIDMVDNWINKIAKEHNEQSN